jgi:hypothetical protein
MCTTEPTTLLVSSVADPDPSDLNVFVGPRILHRRIWIRHPIPPLDDMTSYKEIRPKEFNRKTLTFVETICKNIAILQLVLAADPVDQGGRPRIRSKHDPDPQHCLSVRVTNVF